MPERVTDNSFEEKILQMQNAALDISPVSGLTHRFYRYPARFSPMFAATAIEEFSTPGDLVLDPFVGGGTTLVEAMAHGRLGVGCDLNSLANFVARAKTTFLSEEQRTVMREWADYAVPQFTYRSRIDTEDVVCPERTRNLNGRSTRHLKKVIALALANLPVSAGPETERFARCAILRTAQWALDGRRKRPSASEFRAGIKEAIHEMLSKLDVFQRVVEEREAAPNVPVLIHDDAVNLQRHPPFNEGALADLVVTSPPYPGIHVIYHRWQVDGRKETPAPYWVTASKDGKGSSYYTFGDHRGPDDAYFGRLLATMRGVRDVTKTGAFFVQAVSFRDRSRQLHKYLRTMERVGFEEVRRKWQRRIRRSVPRRKWHASQKGSTPASREVVLIHQAV